MGSALVVIDVQEGPFQSSPQPAFAEQIFSRINALTSRARKLDIPVIFVQHETAAGELRHGTSGWALAKELGVHGADIIVRKTTPDSFHNTTLNDILTHVGVDNLVVCGFATEFCVDTTVRRAATLGYSVTLVSDAHTTRDKKHASAAQIITHHNITLSSISSFPSIIRTRLAQDIHFSNE
ncbi:MAG: hypothetical protein FD177_768 [Desulfovibrionaceae bacterium]|nr:MAG: hypothetical protein FD177_768 [Desulfovibrionaceae bacterium]